MDARSVCVTARKPKGDLTHLLEPLGIRRSMVKISHYLKSPGGIFALGAVTAVIVLNPAGALGIYSFAGSFAVNIGLALVPGTFGAQWEKHCPSGKMANLSSTVAEIRREADQQQVSFYYNVMPLLEHKFLLFKSHQSKVLDINRISPFSSNRVRLAALHDEQTVEKSSSFFSMLHVVASNYNGRQTFNEGGLLGTAYSFAAAIEFEDTVQSVIKRGLSSLLNCHDADAAAEQFLCDLRNRGTERSIPSGQESDVMYIAVSYRYVNKNGLTSNMWREAVATMTDIGKRLGYDRIRIWVDKLTVTEGMEWSTVGFLPYLIFPTFVHANARGDSNRLWIELEKFAAGLGPGILTEHTTEDDVMAHLVISRSPAECLLSFAEVLVSGCLQRLNVTYEKDRQRMVQWGKALLTTRQVKQMFTVPRYDLEGRGEIRHDASMLCLFDDDLKDNYAVRAYIQHSGSQMRQRRMGNGQAWDGMMEILGHGKISNSEEIRELIEKTAFVLHTPNTVGCHAVVWYVVCTLRGKVVVEVHLEGTAGTNVRQWEVIRCRRLQKVEVEASAFNEWFRVPIAQLELKAIPHRELKWVWRKSGMWNLWGYM